jgi:hypothetical protein
MSWLLVIDVVLCRIRPGELLRCEEDSSVDLADPFALTLCLLKIDERSR